MGDKGKFTIFFKQKIEPFVAIGIFIMLILLVTALWNEHQTTKQINENCGWGDEKYYCYCDKDVVMGIELELKPPQILIDLGDFKNVKVDG